MSYSTPPPPARQRPATVTVSSALLVGVAVLYLFGFIVAMTQVGAMSDIYSEAVAGTDLEGSEGILTASTVGGSAVTLLLAAGLLVLAILNNKGKNPSRIVTWVLGGIMVCCSGCGLLGNAVNLQGAQSAGGQGLDPQELERLMNERLPGWYEPASLLLNLGGLVALLVALILLALPASNAFFRKPEPPPFEPPPPAYPPVG